MTEDANDSDRFAEDALETSHEARDEPTTPAIEAVRAARIPHTITRHGPVGSLAEAAAIRGIEPRDLIKTLVVRRSEDEHVFVLVPGDRTFSWAKVRALLGTSRISMPDAAAATEVTGYERGTITPFGSNTALPVIADTHLVGRRISIGGGAHGVGLTVEGDDVIRLFDATVADISDEETQPTGGSAPRVPPEGPRG